MKLVIDVPEEVIVNDTYGNYFGCLSGKLYETLCNATVIPKKCGNLIDADALKASLIENEWITNTDGGGLEDLFDNTPIIIKADKEK